METTDLCFTPATELAVMLRRRTLSPVEIMDAVLARIEALNPRLNAYLAIDAEGDIALLKIDPPSNPVRPLPLDKTSPQEGESVVVANIDFEHQDRIRKSLPALTHRRTEVLGL